MGWETLTLVSVLMHVDLMHVGWPGSLGLPVVSEVDEDKKHITE